MNNYYKLKKNSKNISKSKKKKVWVNYQMTQIYQKLIKNKKINYNNKNKNKIKIKIIMKINNNK